MSADHREKRCFGQFGVLQNLGDLPVHPRPAESVRGQSGPCRRRGLRLRSHTEPPIRVAQGRGNRCEGKTWPHGWAKSRLECSGFARGVTIPARRWSRPQIHDGTEQPAQASSAVALDSKQHHQDGHCDRHHVGSQAGGQQFQALNGAQHRDGRQERAGGDISKYYAQCAQCQALKRTMSPTPVERVQLFSFI